MPAQPISRRKFLTAGCVAVAGIGLTIGGVSVLIPGADPSAIDLPSYSYGDKTLNNRILVAYASRSGATAGVAEAIGKTLADSGAQVDVLTMKDVQDLTPYQAVIAGSAINGGKWLPEAVKFVEAHQSELRRIPTAFFLVSMLMAKETEQHRNYVAEFLAPVRAMVKPVAEGRFAGALYPQKYPFLTEGLGLRVFLAYLGLPAGDYRNWDSIRAWAASTRPLLLQ